MTSACPRLLFRKGYSRADDSGVPGGVTGPTAKRVLAVPLTGLNHRVIDILTRTRQSAAIMKAFLSSDGAKSAFKVEFALYRVVLSQKEYAGIRQGLEWLQKQRKSAS